MNGHIAVVGLGWGDETKGATVDWLCRRDGVPSPIAVVRLGGHQAGHNVVEPGGRHHTFSQFGSGTLAGVPTFLSRYMTVDPLALTAEADHLIEIGIPEPYPMLTVDSSCLVVTPFHQRGNLHNVDNMLNGTCGKGHGEAIRMSLEHPEEVLRARDLLHLSDTFRILALQERRFGFEYPEAKHDDIDLTELARAYHLFAHVVRQESSAYLALLMEHGNVIFEHSQGVLLDEWYGFHPNTTWSTTTFENIDKLVKEAGAPSPYRLGCLRAYTTRHGAGPFPTEDKALDVLHEPHNQDGMQGRFRRGHFDAVLHRYAIYVCGGVDGIALSHLDAVQEQDIRMCLRYTHGGHEPFVDRARNLNVSRGMGNRLRMALPVYESERPTPLAVEGALGYRVVMVADGPTHENRYEATTARLP